MKQPSESSDARLQIDGKIARALVARRRTSQGQNDAQRLAKVSHTLSAQLADRLAAFSFFQNVSESAVIEEALVALFQSTGDENELGDALRKRGLGLRRKVS